MGSDSGISWTTHTWNPWQGCTPVHTGCDHCYMARDKRRWGQDPWTVVRSARTTFRAPLARDGMGILKWAPGDMVFVESWGDFFHVDADPWRADALDIIDQRPDLVFQIPTKRIERVLSVLPDGWLEAHPNVWLGYSPPPDLAGVADLLRVPAAVRFLSLEPLVESIPDLGLFGTLPKDIAGGNYRLGYEMIHWVIVGAESGRDRRPCRPEWVRSIVDECRDAGVPSLVKQLHDSGGRVIHPGHPEWPDWAVQEFPEVVQ